LTSKDEERETWTAESLRISGCLKASAFSFWDRTKDFGGTRFKGYTIVARDVNRRRLSASASAFADKEWWDLVKRCDQPV
jgi:hypothetical protein